MSNVMEAGRINNFEKTGTRGDKYRGSLNFLNLSMKNSASLD